MARFETTGLNDVIKQMEKFGELLGPTADEMLLASAEVVKQEWKQAAEEAGHRDTGAMIASIGYPRKPKTINDIKSIDIYPRGKDERGMSNASKAFLLNYGTAHIKGSRFVEVADRRSGPKVERVMKEIWEKRLKEKGITEQ